jgi:hypothetical protein
MAIHTIAAMVIPIVSTSTAPSSFPPNYRIAGILECVTLSHTVIHNEKAVCHKT